MTVASSDGGRAVCKAFATPATPQAYLTVEESIATCIPCGRPADPKSDPTWPLCRSCLARKREVEAHFPRRQEAGAERPKWVPPPATRPTVPVPFVSRFAGECSACRGEYRVGDRLVWLEGEGRGAVHEACLQLGRGPL